MNWHEDLAGESPEFKQALKHFKASMDAWGDAALSRPRTATPVAVRPGWRPAASWALGCLLAAGSLAGAVHAIVHRQEMARQAVQKAAQQSATRQASAAPQTVLPVGAQVAKSAPLAATQKAGSGVEDESLLASVDNDVSRQVPAAMEPLAQLMDNNGTQ
jgi:hypothetical protein